MDGELISIARGRLAKAAPYLAPLFYRLEPVPKPGLSRPGTDGCRFFYDPDWLKNDFETGGHGACAALSHATAHCLLGHVFERTPDLGADMAAQLFIEERLPEYCPCRADGLYREARRRLSGVSWVDVPAAMASDGFFAENGEALRALLAVDDHGLWRQGTSIARASADGGEADWAAARRTYVQRGAGGQRGIGRAPGSEVLKPRRLSAPDRDYGALLRRYAAMQEEPREDTDGFDPGLYAYGLRQYGTVPLIEPPETRESKRLRELAVVIDTSGSCVRSLTERFLAETCALISDETLFSRSFNLRILQCDARVRRDDVIRSAREFEKYIEGLEIVGGGGTDYTAAFCHIDRLIERGAFRPLPCVLYLTDGRGVYPREKPGYDAIFIGYRGQCDWIDAPAWANRLELDWGIEA